MGSCGVWAEEWERRSIGVLGCLVFWGSVLSSWIAIGYRSQLTADAFLIPLLLLPTGITGLFSSIFIWIYVSFLWFEDSIDSMKTLAFFTTGVTFLLDLITLGFSVSLAFSDGNRFYMYMLLLTLSMGGVFIAFFFVVGRRKCKMLRDEDSDDDE